MSGLPQYLLASRQGLYIVNREGCRLLTQGRFFGVVCAKGAVYAFLNTAPDAESDAENSGCIMRYRWDGGALTDGETMVDGLDHNCHQIDFFDDTFFVVDTLHQCIREYDKDWRPIARRQLLAPAPRDSLAHAHVNSITGNSDTVYVLLHNYYRNRPSEIVEFDRQFRPRRLITLPCTACHDIVMLEDGQLLTCLSPVGKLAVVGERVFQIDAYWTRGLAVGAEEIAVGSSHFGRRVDRGKLPGFVTFLDREFQQRARIYIPAAPTQIRCFDLDPQPR